MEKICTHCKRYTEDDRQCKKFKLMISDVSNAAYCKSFDPVRLHSIKKKAVRPKTCCESCINLYYGYYCIKRKKSILKGIETHCKLFKSNS